MKKNQIHVYMPFDADMYEQIKQAAFHQTPRVTVRAWIRQACAEYLEKKRRAS